MRHAIPTCFYALLFVAGVLLFIHTGSDIYPEYSRDENMLYPRFILVAWVLCAGWAMLRSFRHGSGETSQINMKAFAIASLVSGGYLILLVPLGFWISSVLFFIGYGLALGFRRWGILIVSAIAVTGIFWWLFEGFLAIPLPRGILA